VQIVRPFAHDTVVERLWSAAREGRLPHALLLEGPEGVGKFVAARWFAAGLLCSEGPGPPCGLCGPCKRVESDNHPDLFAIDPIADGEERIKIDRIALRGDSDGGPEGCLEAFLDLRAMEGGRRCVLVREAHRMNDAAQNALLKTLEEPRPGIVLVLESHRSARLLPTILSRCVRVRLGGLAAEDARRVLDHEGVPAEEARELVRWTEGSPGRALAWRARGAARMLALLDGCLDGSRPPLRVAADLWEVEGEFPGPTPSAQARERARFVLDLVLALARDAARLAAGKTADELPQGDRAAHVTLGSGRSARSALDRLLTCRADVDRNLAPEAVLERALLVLAERGRNMGAPARR